MMKFIKSVMKKQILIDKTNKFVSELTDEVEQLSDSERVEIINQTKSRIKNFLEVKNQNLNQKLNDNNKALFMLMNPNSIENNTPLENDEK